MLLENLRDRIRDADILIMDIGSSDGTGLNHNVLLETGMAIAYGSERLRDIFILKPSKLREPSDLTGFLFTNYSVIKGSSAIKIVDAHGFQAALRSSIIRIAQERQMIGARRRPNVESEDDRLSRAKDGEDRLTKSEKASPVSKAANRNGQGRT
jgi:hypothetical protein